MARRLVVLSVIALLTAANVWGQQRLVNPFEGTLRFNFGNPGARALGMGGAFLGRADDASAAEANPAGLTILTRTEFTVEGRRLGYRTSMTGNGVIDLPASLPQAPITTQRFSESRTSLSFASVVFPLGNFVLAGYYHLPLDYQFHGSRDIVSGAVSGTQLAGELPGDFAIRYRMRTVGVAAAWKMGSLSLGATIRRQTLSPQGSTEFFGVDTDPSHAATFLHRTSAVNGSVTNSGSDSKYSYTFGAKWATAGDRLSVGGVYKQGKRFSFSQCVSDQAGCTGNPTIGSAALDVPKLYGAGLSFRPIEPLTINADAVRVKYSSLLSSFSPFEPCGVVPCTTTDPKALGYSSPDVTELHVGGEWAFPTMSVPFAIRAGWWRDPAHSIEFKPGFVYTNPDPVVQDYGRALLKYAAAKYKPSNTENHYSVGFGYLGKLIEINAAYDHSTNSNTAAISLLKRF